MSWLLCLSPDMRIGVSLGSPFGRVNHGAIPETTLNPITLLYDADHEVDRPEYVKKTYVAQPSRRGEGRSSSCGAAIGRPLNGQGRPGYIWFRQHCGCSQAKSASIPERSGDQGGFAPLSL